MKKCCLLLFLLLLDAGDFLSFYAPLVNDLDLLVGTGSATYTRSTTGTVKDYNDNVVTCDINEARFQGARRIHGVTTGKPNGFWSDQSAENAIEFDGADDDVLVSDDTAIQNVFDGGGTISAWIKPKSIGESAGRVFDKSGGATANILFITDESSNTFTLDYIHEFSGTNGRWGTSSRDIGINEWYHIVLVYDNSSVSNDPTVYINNVVKTVGSGLDEVATPVGTRTTDAGNDFYIGNSNAQNRSWDGAIDNVKIWTTELTATEVAAEYNQGRKSTNLTQASSLAGWWKLDNDTSDIVDSSGNGNNGTFRSGGVGASPTNVDGRYDDGTTLTTLKGILIEEQRTNLIDYSEALDNATGGWTELSCTAALNQALSPDGINSTATKVTPDVGTNTTGIEKGVSGLTDNTVYTFSIFAKRNDYQWIRISTRAKDNSFTITWFDLSTPAIGTQNHTTARIESFASGWVRCQVQADVLSGGTTPGVFYLNTDANGISGATGDGSNYNLFWGAQVEEGSMATSYVATAGATATRTKDTLYYDAIGNVNEAKGSVVCDFNMLGLDTGSFPGVVSISKDGSNFYSLYGLPTNSKIYLAVQTGVAQALITGSNDSIIPNTDQSVGFTYKTDFIEGFIDGSSFGTDTNGATLPTSLTKIYIGATSTGLYQGNATIKEVQIYKKKLSDSDMEAATVWSPWETWGS